MIDNLKSRKFWLCVAAFLGSVATSIVGLKTDNQTVLIIGTVCGILSCAIYSFCEAWIDTKSATRSHIMMLSNDLDEEEDEEEGDE